MPSCDSRGDRVGVLARAAVHDRRARVLGSLRTCSSAAHLRATRALALHAHHVEGEVRPVEARADRHPVAQPQPRGDLLRHARRGRRRRRHHRRASERGDRVVQAQVVGPEVVAPLGHAVRLVDHEQRHLALRQRRAEGARGEALGRRQHEARLARLDVPQRLRVVALLHPRGQHRRAHARLLQPPPLVGHQRDQRAHDDDQPDVGQRRQLVAERLAAARRHHHQAVAARQRRLHRLALARPERVQAEAVEQLLGRRARGARSGGAVGVVRLILKTVLRASAATRAAGATTSALRSPRTHAGPPRGGPHHHP